MSYSTGVTERDNLILRAIQTATACRDPITVESLSGGHLPQDFDLDHDELVGILNNLEPVPEPVPEQHSGKPMLGMETLPDGRRYMAPQPELSAPSRTPVDAVQEAEDAPSTPQVAPEPMPSGEYVVTDKNTARVMPKIAENEARRALDVANARLSRARDNMAIARGVLRERRSDLASAIMRWQILGNNLDNKNDATSRSDREQREIRNHLASTQAERERRAKLKITNNTAKTFVQRQMTNGPSRGAFDRSAAARVGYFNRDPRRGAVVKVPSER